MATPYMPSMNFHKQPSRIRSYSVNNKDIHADEYPDENYDSSEIAGFDSYEALQNEIEKTQAAIRHHNLAVQAFTNQASSTRRRARTAGVLDAPHTHLMSSYFSNSIPGGPNSIGMGLMEDQKFDDLSQSVSSMSLGRSNSRNAGLLSVDDQGLEGPTSALWLGNLPASTTTTTLLELFKPHGNIVSVRVLTHKSCGFVNFERVESAISAKASMNGTEILPGASPIRINFAKPPSPANTPGHDGAFPSPSPDPFAKSQDTAQSGSASAVGDSNAVAAVNNVAPTPPAFRDITEDILEIVKHFEASEQDRDRISHSLTNAMTYHGYVEEIPSIREPSHARVHDAPKLRELRKRIDNQSLSVSEIEDAAVNMLPEIAELSSDYLGNTVVQKLFDNCSDPIKDAMLTEIAPHLAEIGCHKNGTWAAQKIIDVCKTTEQRSSIAEHIHPYTVPLFLDQFGNYVVQGCLKYGTPHNNFIFETMMSRMAQLSQARFGARAMRACLESHHATKDQQMMLAAQIAIHSVNLATDQNGALLLTWYLDTCTLPQRRSVLAPRLAPYLVHLCTHKVAYLTVLKVINQKHETEARDTILNALFFSPNDQILEAILRDSNCGATLIFKVLTTPFLDNPIRGQAVENVKNVLLRIKTHGIQGYKRLMDEVGLSTRNSGPARESSGQPETRQRPNSRHANPNGQQGQQGPPGKQFYNQPNQQAGYDMGYSQRNEMADSSIPAFPTFNQAMMYNGSNGGMPPMSMQQQVPYQQNMMGRGAPPASYNFPASQGGYGAYGNAGPSADQYRQMNMPNGSPIQPPAAHMQQVPNAQGSFQPPPGFGMPMGGGGYGYGNMNIMQNMSSNMNATQNVSNMNYGQQGQGNRRHLVSITILQERKEVLANVY